jgi:hypothetical protein
MLRKTPRNAEMLLLLLLLLLVTAGSTHTMCVLEVLSLQHSSFHCRRRRHAVLLAPAAASSSRIECIHKDIRIGRSKMTCSCCTFVQQYCVCLALNLILPLPHPLVRFHQRIQHQLSPHKLLHRSILKLGDITIFLAFLLEESNQSLLNLLLSLWFY